MYHLILVLWFVCYSIPVHATLKSYVPNTETTAKKNYSLELTGSWFKSSATYDEKGVETPFAADESYNRYQGELIGRYGFGRKLEFRLGGKYRQHSSSRGATDYSSSGFESGLIGAKFRFPKMKKFNFAGDFQFQQTFYSNDGNAGSSDLILGDDGSTVTLGLFSSINFMTNKNLGAYVAYNKPPSHLSPEVLYNFHGAYGGKKMAFLLGVKGVYSLGNDDYTGNPAGKPTLGQTGATNLYNSINRGYMAPYLGLNFATKSMRLGTEIGQVISGKSTDKGLEAKISILWPLGKPIKDREKIEAFKEYDIEATVIKVSPRGKFIKIDQGLGADISKGMRFDIFKTDYFGSNLLVASGLAYQIGTDWTIIKLVKKYRAIRVQKGFSARAQ